MQNKKLCKLDSAALAAKTAELARKMWKRLKQKSAKNIKLI